MNTYTEYHVDPHGNDGHDGSAEAPIQSISEAARRARAGDCITIHSGTYREWINPPNGGDSDDKRITYQAAPGAKPKLKGSEIIKGWQNVQTDIWRSDLPNTFFGDSNPYANRIKGDWFGPKGRAHHTGAVYLNGDWLSEATSLKEVTYSTEPTPLWFAVVGETNTTIWARFSDFDPNDERVEINVRQSIFYPAKVGINYLTIRGLTMCHAATPWAPPTAEQIGLIGTNWSRGWVIENNIISHSKCCGITLGKYGDRWDNKSADSAEGFNDTIKRALKNGWAENTVGSHIVRHNEISHCEQAGVVGSLGGIFSQITGNHIHNIWCNRQFEGAEMAGIKIHAAIDTLIEGNRIHQSGRGIWLDWMAQGTRVTRNLCYDNSTDDLFMEVNHGPFTVDNNIFASPVSVRDCSEGGAYAHNLITGKINFTPQTRLTPYHHPHSTKVRGVAGFSKYDNRYYNNVFVGTWVSARNPHAGDRSMAGGQTGFGLWPYDEAGVDVQLETGGNFYYTDARPSAVEKDATECIGVDPSLDVVEQGDQVELHITLGQLEELSKCSAVTTARLDQAVISKLPFLNPNGSVLNIDTDYFRQSRNPLHPKAGPFEIFSSERMVFRVW